MTQKFLTIALVLIALSLGAAQAEAQKKRSKVNVLPAGWVEQPSNTVQDGERLFTKGNNVSILVNEKTGWVMIAAGDSYGRQEIFYTELQMGLRKEAGHLRLVPKPGNGCSGRIREVSYSSGCNEIFADAPEAFPRLIQKAFGLYSGISSQRIFERLSGLPLPAILSVVRFANTKVR